MLIAEKFQSNPDIAGSPRNNFRTSLVIKIIGGKALNGLGAVSYTHLSMSIPEKRIYGMHIVTGYIISHPRAIHASQRSATS